MDQATIARYQVGGDIYNTLMSQYGADAANSIANAAITGDRTQVASAIASAKGDGPVLNESTGSILATQLLTDPLAAPLGAANTLIGNSVFSFLKNPFVLATIGGGLFLYLGGGKAIRRFIENL
jgi:hypothetical protein